MSIKVEVWGDYACFSRPEMKVERVSYDVITPSAARGLIEAIYWHPGIKYKIDRIHVCEPIRFTNIRRNEVKDIVSCKDIDHLIKYGGEKYIFSKESIQQRAAMVLRNVRYVIEAHFEITEKAAPSDNAGKFIDILSRRLEKGQCYHQPCFGTREFPARFKLCDKIPDCPKELEGTKDLGWMLLDLDYSDVRDIKPMFFRAIMNNGEIIVPDIRNKEVVK